MRNIEILRHYFLGKDPQLKETLADNSLRLIGIPGREFALKLDVRTAYEKAKAEWEAGDEALREEMNDADQKLRTDMNNADDYLQQQIYNLEPGGGGNYVKIVGDTMTGRLQNKANIVISDHIFDIGDQPGSLSLSVGQGSIASGANSSAMGLNCSASETSSHAEGQETEASANYSHAEGRKSIASGLASHAEGRSTALGSHSHSEGYMAYAWKDYSHASGYQTSAMRPTQFVIGKNNILDNGTSMTSDGGIFIVGNGTDVNNVSNALKLNYNGDLYIAGTLTSNNADYAETTEWLDGNPNGEDRVGKFVCMQGTKMRLATASDIRSRIGIVSANPSVCGDSFDSYWHGKYKTNLFGRIETQMVTTPAEYDEEGNIIVPELTVEANKLADNFDPTQEYVPRLQRKEYGNFAMLGKLVVIDDGTCVADGYCYPNNDGIATLEQDANKGFYVMERLDQTHIRVLLK